MSFRRIPGFGHFGGLTLIDVAEEEVKEHPAEITVLENGDHLSHLPLKDAPKEETHQCIRRYCSPEGQDFWFS